MNLKGPYFKKTLILVGVFLVFVTIIYIVSSRNGQVIGEYVETTTTIVQEESPTIWRIPEGNETVPSELELLDKLMGWMPFLFMIAMIIPIISMFRRVW